ncbi:hypothetical protein BC835DRAFT_1341150 [Cytidiella melzeri]|nr:hypothetical protein BC835DRAFT_1341150 [Cytidiella melzeri]
MRRIGRFCLPVSLLSAFNFLMAHKSPTTDPSVALRTDLVAYLKNTVLLGLQTCSLQGQHGDRCPHDQPQVHAYTVTLCQSLAKDRS